MAKKLNLKDIVQLEVAEVEEDDAARLAIVKATPGPPTIRPYCGAKASNAFQVGTTRMKDRGVHGCPAPAWADVGMASHMRNICGLVPTESKVQEISRGAAPENLKPKFDRLGFAFRLGVALSAVLENVACYFAYLEARNPHKHLYNKYEANAIGMPKLSYVLLGLAVANTFYLFVHWTAVVVLRLDLMRFLAGVRAPLSMACGATCSVVLFYGESTKEFSFFCVLFCCLHLWCLALGMLLPKKEREPPRAQKLAGYALLVVVGGWTVALVVLFLIGEVAFLRNSVCVGTENRAMPVKVEGVREWQCVKWGATRHIDRRVASPAVYEGQCFTTFHVFDDAETGAPSADAHLIHCPPQCQTLDLGTLVMGCRVYDARTPVCAAAVQMGVLPPDAAGTIKVVGRAPPQEGFGMCNLNGVASVQTLAEMPTFLQAQGGSGATGAFYFQGVSGMEADDMITLHGFRQTSHPSKDRPWESYTANVSWVVGGGEVQTAEVVLGPSTNESLGIELNFCHGRGSAPNECA